MEAKGESKNHDGSTCVVCYRHRTLFSIGECDHPVCYECSTRMRVLCRQNECPICRREISKVIFTKVVAPFRDLCSSTLPIDRKYRISFSNEHAREKFHRLLDHVCPMCRGYQNYPNFAALRDHVMREHDKHYCDLCIDNLKIFSKERQCYSRAALALHRRKGDPDDTSHKGHPLCKFCDTRFMDSDALYLHLRRDHYFCHFCDADGFHQYYPNYDELRVHFGRDHYLCEDGECKREQFTSVFRSDIDLKAHRAVVHLANASKAASKQARTLELEFTYAPRSQHSHQRSHRDEEHHHERHERRPRAENQAQSVTTVVREEPPPPPPPQPEIAIDMRDANAFPSLPSKSNRRKSNNNKANSNTTTMAQKLSANRGYVVEATRNDGHAKWKKNSAPVSSDKEFPGLPGASTNTTVQVALKTSKPIAAALGTHNNRAEVTRVTASGNITFQSNNASGVNEYPALPSRPSRFIPPSNVCDSNNNKSKSNRTKTGGSQLSNGVANYNSHDVEMNSGDTWVVEKGAKGKIKTKFKGGGNTVPTTKNKSSKYVPGLVENEAGKENRNTQVESNSVPQTKKSQIEITAAKEGNAMTYTQNVEEFPSLAAGGPTLGNKIYFTDGVSKPDPEPKPVRAPPGFSEKNGLEPVTAPPPGFFISPGSSSKPPQSANGVVRNGDQSEYIPPPEFNSRNATLMDVACSLFSTQEMEAFKDLSVEFRSGKISAREYHDGCIKKVNKDAFLVIFPELLTLLPDIMKQKDLWAVHTNWQKKNKASSPNWSTKDELQLCTVCQQVVLPKDFQFHLSEHTLFSSFPSLPEPAKASSKQTKQKVSKK